MKYFLGLDIGTTAIKALIVGEEGGIHASASQGYDLYIPHDGWVEQDAKQMWRTTVSVLRSAIQSFPGDRSEICALSLSTQRDTLVCVDAGNRPIRNAITWMDGRSADECRQLAETFGSERVYEITGVGVNTIWTLAFILWMRAHEPDKFAAAACFGLVHDFILCRMGAEEHVLDTSNACQTMLYDFRANRWSPELMEYAGLTENRLPILVPPGTCVGEMSPSLAAELGLSGHVALVSGGGDQQCAALGAGACREGDIEIGIGTAANLLMLTSQPHIDPMQRVICHRSVQKGLYVMEGAMLAMGRLVEWLKQEFYGELSLRELDRVIGETSPVGARGLVVLPHFEGAACPYWNPKATGVIQGLTLSTGKADIARAVIESTAFEIKKSVDLLAELGFSAGAVRVSGGAARSALWMQILSDILCLDIQVPESSDCAAIGAAMLAGVGCGTFDAAQLAGLAMNPIRKVYSSDESLREMYQEKYEKNRDLYRRLYGGERA